MFRLLLSTPDYSGVAITTDLVEPILDYFIGNIAAIMPVAIAAFGIIAGLGLVPKIIKKFTSA